MSQSCLEALLKLYPYVDGELPPDESQQVRQHFDLCSPCAPALNYMISFRKALQRAAFAQSAAPPALHDRVSRLIRDSQ